MKFIHNLAVGFWKRTKRLWVVSVAKTGVALMRLSLVLEKLSKKPLDWGFQIAALVLSPSEIDAERRDRRFELEFYPNQDICTLHVANEVTSQMILSFDSKNSQLREQTPMVKALFDIKGVSGIVLHPYRISITKGRVYEWYEIMPTVRKVALQHLNAS